MKGLSLTRGASEQLFSHRDLKPVWQLAWIKTTPPLQPTRVSTGTLSCQTDKKTVEEKQPVHVTMLLSSDSPRLSEECGSLIYMCYNILGSYKTSFILISRGLKIIISCFHICNPQNKNPFFSGLIISVRSIKLVMKWTENTYDFSFWSKKLNQPQATKLTASMKILCICNQFQGLSVRPDN